MALNLLNLLGQSIAPQIANSGVVDPEAEEIVVNGGRSRPNVDVDGPDAPFMGNRSYLDEALASVQESGDFSRGERRGMFGTRGTLRDILGIVGDAFLTQSGNDRVYAPQREREKIGDALTGFTNSPEAAAAAIERLAAAGYTDQAQKLQEALQTAELKRAQQASLNAGRENLAADRAWGNYKDARNAISRLLSSPEAQANPDLAIAQAQRIAKMAGVSLEDLGISENMTPEERAIYASGDMTVNQQQNLPLAERRTATGEYNAQTSRINATRPRATSSRSITPTEYLRSLINKPANQRTPDEQAYVEKNTTSSGRGRGRRSVPNSNKIDPERIKRFRPIN